MAFFGRVIYATGTLCILPIETKVKKVTILVSVSVVSGSIVFYCFFLTFRLAPVIRFKKCFIFYPLLETIFLRGHRML